MTEHWRPDKWDEILQKAIDKASPDTFVYDLVVNTLLDTLRTSPECKPSREGAACSVVDGRNTLATRVSIPDDPQPIEKLDKFSTPEKSDNSKEQLMICPKAKECELCNSGHRTPHKENLGCHSACGDSTEIVCPVCVPYEPEKRTLWVTLGEYQYPHAQFPSQPHKASKVIESGYFCDRCGQQVTSKSNDMIIYHWCPRNYTVSGS